MTCTSFVLKCGIVIFTIAGWARAGSTPESALSTMTPGTLPTISAVASDGGESPDSVAKFDVNHDGFIDRIEFEAYARARARRLVTINADGNKDGFISDEEYKTYRAKFDEKVEEHVQDDLVSYDLKVKTQKLVTIRDVEREWKPITSTQAKKSASSDSAFALLLRVKPEDLDVSFDKAQPATLSYSRDFNSNADIWETHGVIAIRYLTKQTESPFQLTLTGSAAFDRLTNSKDRSKEVNALVPRLQAAIALPGDGVITDLHQFRADLAYATDFDVRSKVPAIELEYEPTMFNLGVGVYRPIFGLAYYRWRVILHGEYGRVVDAGDKKELLKIEHSDFLRLGPNLQLEIEPAAPELSRLSFTLTFEHLNDIQNGGSVDLFTATAKYQLDETGNFFLTLDYRNGDVPLLEEKTNLLMAGIGIKF